MYPKVNYSDGGRSGNNVLQIEGLAGVVPIATVGRVPVEKENCPATDNSREVGRRGPSHSKIWIELQQLLQL